MTNTNLNGILFSLETYYVTPIIVLSSIQVTNRAWTLLFHLFLIKISLENFETFLIKYYIYLLSIIFF